MFLITLFLAIVFFFIGIYFLVNFGIAVLTFEHQDGFSFFRTAALLASSKTAGNERMINFRNKGIKLLCIASVFLVISILLMP